MLQFKSFQLLSEQKNTHMTHLEDRVIYGGVDGARQAINALRELRNMLAGSSKSSVNVTVKWDGAPAVFAGYDPTDGQFFVAKKGIFNKNPKVYKTPAEIDSDTSGDLATKLKECLKYLPDIIKSGVYQGDLMFTASDIKTETIDDEKYYTFQPNTIVYAVPVNSDGGKQIKASKLGIVFHTKYTGNEFESMKASFDVTVNDFKRSASVWVQDATLKDLSGTATLTQKDTDEVTQALSKAGKIFRQIAGTTLREIENNQSFAQTIETYNNTFVRSGAIVTNTAKHVDGLIKYINDKYQKEIDKRKTEKGKQAQIGARDDVLKFFSSKNKANLKLIFDLQLAIIQAKLIIIKKLNQLNSLKTFAKTRQGFKVTGVEGYVAIDKLGGGAVKLVDRLEFSYLNFSSDVIKGWEKS